MRSGHRFWLQSSKWILEPILHSITSYNGSVVKITTQLETLGVFKEKNILPTSFNNTYIVKNCEVVGLAPGCRTLCT
jgi:hypothetical protein